MNRAVLLLVKLGLVLALVLCWAAEPKAEEAKAIAEIKKIGGWVFVDEKSPDKPAISVQLGSSDVTDAGLVNIKGLTTLRWLQLRNTKVTDSGLVHLEGLTKLQSLDLLNTNVTDAGLVHLKGLTQLQSLDLRSTAVTDAGLDNLRGLLQQVD